MRCMTIIIVLIIRTIAIGQVEDSTEIFKKAKTAFENYDYNSALTFADSLVQNIDSVGREVANLRSDIYERLGEYDKAILELKKIECDEISHRIKIAELYIKDGNYKYAAKLFWNIFLQNPELIYPKLRASDCQYKLGLYKEAFTGYKFILTKDPQNYKALKMITSIANIMDLPDSAINYGERAVNIKREPVVLRMLCENYFRKKDYFNTVRWGLKLLNMGDTTYSVSQKMGISSYYIARDSKFDAIALKNKEAIKYLSFAYSLNSTDPITPFYISLAYKELDSLDKSLEWFEKTENMIFPDYLAEFYFQYGDVLQRKEKYQDAIDRFSESLKYDPEKNAVLFYLAMAMDKYYKDKTIVSLYYKTYQSKMDTLDPLVNKYIENRLEALREYIHFNGNK